jgi:hypothetical protein
MRRGGPCCDRANFSGGPPLQDLLLVGWSATRAQCGASGPAHLFAEKQGPRGTQLGKCRPKAAAGGPSQRFTQRHGGELAHWACRGSCLLITGTWRRSLTNVNLRPFCLGSTQTRYQDNHGQEGSGLRLTTSTTQALRVATHLVLPLGGPPLALPFCWLWWDGCVMVELNRRVPPKRAVFAN